MDFSDLAENPTVFRNMLGGLFFFLFGVLNREFLPSVNKIKISCLLG